MLVKQDFSTDDAPEGARARLFQQEMADLFSVGLAVTPTDHRALRTRMTCYRGPRLQFAALRFSPHKTSAARVTSQGPHRMLATLQKEGDVIVSQDGRENRITPGDIFLIDPSRPFAIETGEILTHSIYLLPSTLRELNPRIDALTATPIKGSGGMGGLFRALIDEVFALAPVMTDAMADTIADTIPVVLAAALTSLRQADDDVPARQSMLHRQRIRRFVLDNLYDPELDADMIARGVNLSARYIFKLFENEPKTLMKWVWEERLKRCSRELSSPALASRSVGEIAFGWGFNDLAHFSRAFRQNFGASPREFRRAAISRALT